MRITPNWRVSGLGMILGLSSPTSAVSLSQFSGSMAWAFCFLFPIPFHSMLLTNDPFCVLLCTQPERVTGSPIKVAVNKK